MELEMVLNDLSLRSPAPDIHIAPQWMSALISTAVAAVQHGVKQIIRTHSGFHATLLAPNYPLVSWLNDNSVDRDTRRYLLTTTKFPFLVDLHDPNIQDNILLSEFSCDGEPAEGLGIAYLLEALPISVRSEQRWESSRLVLEAKQLQDDGSISTTRITIVHASDSGHLLEHDAWIQERRFTSVRDGSDLWNRRRSLFASVSFCDAVGKQVQGLHIGHPLLRPVIRRLFELENYCKNQQVGPFDPNSLPTRASPESQSTLQQFGRERTFLCPDGQERVFSWHVRLTPGAWRIHFSPGPDVGEIIVGYIGPH